MIQTTPNPRSGWTPERRAKQSAMMRRLKPWTRSTGPKTPQGKKRSSLNAYKHGMRSAALLRLRAVMAMQSRWLKTCVLQPPLQKQNHDKRTIEPMHYDNKSCPPIPDPRPAMDKCCAIGHKGQTYNQRNLKRHHACHSSHP